MVGRVNTAEAVTPRALFDDACGGQIDTNIGGDAGGAFLAVAVVAYNRRDSAASVALVPAKGGYCPNVDVDLALVQHRDIAARHRLRLGVDTAEIVEYITK